MPTIQRLVGCRWRALRDWCQAYRAKGLGGLKSPGQGAKARNLSRDQRAALKARLNSDRPDPVLSAAVRISQGQVWTVSDRKVVVQRWYGVSYRRATSYQTLLHDWGLSQQQAESQYRSRPEAQTIADVEAGKKVADLLQAYPNAVILAMAQRRLDCQATLRRGWAVRGQTPVVQVSPPPDQVHVYGALAGRRGPASAVLASEQTTAVTAAVVRWLLTRFSTQPSLWLVDRAPWQHGLAVDERLAENPRLALRYFPPACPELNPQEPVWEQPRAAVRHHHPYPPCPAPIDDVETYLHQPPFQTDFRHPDAPPILCDF